MDNETAGSSHRSNKTSIKMKRNSSKRGKKRISRSSHDSFTSDDEPKSINVTQSIAGNKKRKTKKSRKNSAAYTNGNGDLVSGSDDKLHINIGKNSKTNYSDALNLTPMTGSIEEGQRLFGVLIKPIPVDTFMEKYWEQKPIRVQRRFSNYYKDLISTKIIDKMLRENHVEFTKNIDITHYKDGVRETLNPEGRALPPCN